MDRFFAGTIEEKMVTMEEVYACHGVQLLQDTAITDSLALLKGQAASLSRQMTDMDMGSLCSSCAEKAGGGCCSGYMEANSDVILLLMNRLQGTAVRRQHSNPGDCCFLGVSGCILPIKPMFCLNYNCSHIHKRAGRDQMKSLEQLSGIILTEQTRLEAILLQTI